MIATEDAGLVCLSLGADAGGDLEGSAAADFAAACLVPDFGATDWEAADGGVAVFAGDADGV